MGHALSFTFTLIVLNGLDPGKTTKQKVAVAGEKRCFESKKHLEIAECNIGIYVNGI